MKQVTLLHTVRSVYESFAGQLKTALDGMEIEISNTLDEFLAADANRRGEFTQENSRRLLALLQAKDLEQADLIIVTCSTLTPAVEQIRPLIQTPLLAIDDAMMEQAVQSGEQFLLMATAGSAIGPAKQKLLSEAEKAGRTVSVQERLVPEAFRAIQQQDKAAHDRYLLEAAEQAGTGMDAVILAQASMAHLEMEIAERCGCTVFSSPAYCFARARQMLSGQESGCPGKCV